MRLSAINTKAGAEAGAWLHLVHPALEHPLYSGPGADPDTGQLIDPEAEHQRVEVRVLGTESKSVQQRAKKFAAKMERGKKLGAEDEREAMEFVYSLVVAFHGIEGPDGEPLQADADGKRLFFEQSDGLMEQVIEFAKDRENFFKRPSPASG